MENGADFAYAKIWTPQAVSGEQDFRNDTPLFSVNNNAQLRSVVAALRKVAAAEPALFRNPYPPVGIPVDGVPGATIAQLQRTSFNGGMANFWSGPISAACNSLPLRAGQVITGSWLDEAAFRAQSIAYQQAESAGINPACHAIQPEQSLGVILDAARSN